jgi:hypothetical protein
VIPQFLCPPAEVPTLSLSGPCQQNGYENVPDAASIPIFNATDAGTCHATITLSGGEAFSTDLTFAPQWYPCGSNPHGCGEDFESDAGPWMINNSCADAGSLDAMPDVASGDERE